MTFRPTHILAITLCAATLAPAQDTALQFRGQQIAAPDCMNLHNAWDGPHPHRVHPPHTTLGCAI